MANRAQLSRANLAIFVIAFFLMPDARSLFPLYCAPPSSPRAPLPQSLAERIPTSWLGAPQPLASLLPLRINSPGTQNAAPLSPSVFLLLLAPPTSLSPLRWAPAALNLTENWLGSLSGRPAVTTLLCLVARSPLPRRSQRAIFLITIGPRCTTRPLRRELSNFMSQRAHSVWTRDEHVLAFNLYCQLRLGRLIWATRASSSWQACWGRSVGAVSYKLSNFARLDPALLRQHGEAYA